MQQKLDLLTAWRKARLFDDRRRAVLAVTEAGHVAPRHRGVGCGLSGARSVLGEEAFIAVGRVAVTISSVQPHLDSQPASGVCPRDAEGRIVR